MRKSSKSPQSRTHAWLTEHGYVFQKTEQTVHILDKEHPGAMRKIGRAHV